MASVVVARTNNEFTDATLQLEQTQRRIADSGDAYEKELQNLKDHLEKLDRYGKYVMQSKAERKLKNDKETIQASVPTKMECSHGEALLHAAKMGSLKQLQELLHKGAEKDAMDRQKQTALHKETSLSSPPCSKVVPEAKPQETSLSSPPCSKVVPEARSNRAYGLEEDKADDVVTQLSPSLLVFGMLLGHGNFGQVYEARLQGTPVAVKKLYADKKFCHEDAIKMSKIKNKHLATILGVYWKPLAIVMEFYSTCLFHALHVNQQGELNKHRVLSEAASGLAYLHLFDVWHMDLKSANVFLAGDAQTVKLSDFGLAKLKIFACQDMTLNARTMSYKAPELLLEKPCFSDKSDTFAFGVLTWEVCSRRIPYHKWSTVEIIAHIEAGRREDIQRVASFEMRSLIQRAWIQEPDQRPQSEEVVGELSRIWWDSKCQFP